MRVSREALVLFSYFLFSTWASVLWNVTLPLLFDFYGFSASFYGWVSSLSSLAIILSMFPVGFLVDSYGPKTILLSSLFFSSLIPPLFFFGFSNVWFVVVAVLMFELGLSAGRTASLPLLVELTRSSGVAYGVRGALLRLGGLVASLLGGFFVGRYGFMAVFPLISIPLVILLLFCLFLPSVRADVADSEGGVGFLEAYRRFAGSRPVLLKILSSRALSSVSWCVFSYIPLYCLEVGIPRDEVYYLYSVRNFSAIFLALACGFLADRFDRKLLFFLTLAFSSLGFGVIGVGGRAAFYTGFALLTMISLFSSAAPAFLMDLFRDDRGKYAAMERMVVEVFSMLGAPVSGMAFDELPELPFIMAGVLEAASALLIWSL